MCFEDATTGSTKTLVDKPPAKMIDRPADDTISTREELKEKVTYNLYVPGLYLPITTHLNSMAASGATVLLPRRAAHIAMSKTIKRCPKLSSMRGASEDIALSRIAPT